MTNIFDTFKKGDKHSFRIPLLISALVLGGCQFVIVILLAVLAAPVPAFSAEKASSNTELKEAPKTVSQLMSDLVSTVKKRGYQWDLTVFTENEWEHKGYSVQGYPLVYYTCGKKKAKNSSLILANVHGDEITPVFFGFRLVEWLKAHSHLCEDAFVVVAPMVNPDGFMRYTKGTRTNFNKVDLNRNFDTPEWHEKAVSLWKTKFKQRRYFPGDKPGSEPEVAFQKWLIEEFSPTKILSIHAPLNFLDYDGPRSDAMEAFTKTYIEACEDLKAEVKKAADSLNFYAYGVFPGSLGNYAGKHRGIPTFTVELPTTKWEMAPKYFSDLEAGTTLFIKHELKELNGRRVGQNSSK